MKPYKILIVDDEESQREMVRETLLQDGYSFVDTAENRAETLELCMQNRYDLILLDVMLPNDNGFDLIKALPPKSNVIFLTAKDQYENELHGYDLGALDYIAKPYLPEYLLARIRVLLKLICADSDDVVIGRATVNLNAGTVTLEGNVSTLTKSQLLILKELVANRGYVVSTNHLFETIWPDDDNYYDVTLDSHISRLRSKIGDKGPKPRYITCLKGVGYKLER